MQGKKRGGGGWGATYRKRGRGTTKIRWKQYKITNERVKNNKGNENAAYEYNNNGLKMTYKHGKQILEHICMYKVSL